MLLDFTKEIELPKVDQSWQQEIIDFIQEFFENQIITVNTSGSTGKPKSIALPKSAMIQSAQMTGEFLGLKHGDTALLCMPVKYIAGKMMIVRAIELGLKLYCVEPKTKIEFNQKINFGALTPMQAEASFFNSASTLKMDKVILGGAKVSTNLEKRFRSIGSQVYETYGMTETITHIAMRQLNQDAYFKTLKNIEISQDDRSCLVIKTPYFDEKIITNDVVEIVNETSFKLVGRVDNIINSGGIKVNPETLEDKLKLYINTPFIVHYKEDSVLGQKLVLVVESKDFFQIDYPSDLIPRNQQPKEFIFVDEFPRTISGKIIRKQIKL